MAINPDSLFSTLTRREFVKRAGGCAGLSSLSILSTLLNLKMTQSAVAASGTGGDYKALVCMFFFGGMDSRNLLAPFNDAEHAGYVDIRQGVWYDDVANPNGVALPRGGGDPLFGGAGLLDPADLEWGMSLKPIRPKAGSINAGRDFGIHGYFNAGRKEDRDSNGDVIAADKILPSEDYMREMYNNQNLTFVCNVGSLVNPDTNKQNWRNFRPVGLFSHSDEQRNWMTAMPENQSQNIGFLGRTADMLLDSCNQDSKIAMNIVMDNFRTMTIGETTLPYIINRFGTHRFLPGRYPSGNGLANRDRVLTDMTDGVLSQQFANLLELSHSTSRRDAIDAAIEFNAATQNATLLTDWGSNNYRLKDDMKQVARSIIARNELKQERQLFFLSRGGFDNHSNLIGNHNNSMPQVGETVYRFWEEMKAHGLEDSVTLFTASDFERTYGPNSNKGTDHAWASNQFVVGGSQINGGDIVGDQPDSSNPADFNTSGGQYTTDTRGRIFPSHSVDEYMAELIKWFGDFSPSDLEMILPNYSRFAGRDPIGHMA